MVTKARSRLLCCFTGSLVHDDSDELDSTICQSSSKSQHHPLSWWKKKKKKKKTVPVDAAVEIVEVGSREAWEGDVVVVKEVTDKLLSAKKGYFHKFHKKSSSKRRNTKLNHRQQLITTDADITKETQKKTICQVFSKCASPRQPPALLCHVPEPEPVKVGTGPSCTASLAGPKQPSHTIQKAQKIKKMKESQRRRFGQSEQQVVVVLMMVVALGTMLLGGRALAIVCTSGWCYLSTYVKDMSRAKAAINSKST